MANPEITTSAAPKRICIDARFYRKSTAGVGRYTRGLIHHLQQVDTTNQYTVILTPADFAEWPKDTTPPNWHVEVLDIPHYSLAEQTKLLRYLNSQHFDLVHFTMFNHPIAYRKPFVVTIHDLTMTIFPLRPLWHPRTWAYRFVMWHAARAAKRVIAPSQATAHDVHAMLGVPKEKIVVTFEAVEAEFKPVTDAKRLAAVKKKFGITKPFIFFLNAWRPHKGLPELVAAFQTVKQSHDIQLLAGGKPNPSFPEVIAAVDAGKQATGEVIAPGFVSDDDMIALYSMATVFVFPSHYEGFGIPALEALACGCPTIAARNSSIPEAVGEAGIFFKTGDAADLARAIKMVISNPKLQAELKQKGLAQAKKFSLLKMATETRAAYDAALSSHET